MSPDVTCNCPTPVNTLWPCHQTWCPVFVKGKSGPQPTPVHQAPPPPGSSMHDPHLLVDVRGRSSRPCPTPFPGPRTYTVWVVLYLDAKSWLWRTGSRAWQNGTQAQAHLGRLVADGRATSGHIESVEVTIDQEVK